MCQIAQICAHAMLWPVISKIRQIPGFCEVTFTKKPVPFFLVTIFLKFFFFDTTGKGRHLFFDRICDAKNHLPCKIFSKMQKKKQKKPRCFCVNFLKTVKNGHFQHFSNHFLNPTVFSGEKSATFSHFFEFFFFPKISDFSRFFKPRIFLKKTDKSPSLLIISKKCAKTDFFLLGLRSEF